MDENYRHCETLVRAADKDRYLATLFAPAEKRGALFALYAFNAEIASVRERARAPMPGEIRLQWWRDVINGVRTSEAAANPVTAALSDTIARFELPKPRLLDLIEAHAFDLYDDPMPTFQALEGYVRRTSGTIFDIAERIAGGPATYAAERAGFAYGLTALLRSFALHTSRRQFFVPLEFLEGGATPEEAFAGRSSPFLINALGMLRTRARENLNAFESLLPQLPAATMPAFLPVALVPVYLSVMDRPDYDPFKTPVEVPQWRRQWVLWRAAHRWSRVSRR
jgi:phytoene synthase